MGICLLAPFFFLFFFNIWGPRVAVGLEDQRDKPAWAAGCKRGWEHLLDAGKTG